MTVELTHNQLNARNVFISAVLDGEDGGYPDRVTVVPAEFVNDLEKLSSMLDSTIVEGLSLVIVREDGAEMLMEPRGRRGVRGFVDRFLLRRVRVDITTRGEPEHHHERYVHPQHVGDLKSLRGELVACH